MRPRSILSLGNFLSSIFTTLLIYVSIPYLSTFMSESVAGIVIAIGAAIAFIVFLWLPQLALRYGARRCLVGFGILETVALLILALDQSAWSAGALVTLSIAIQPFFWYELDLLLEATVAEEGTTGRVRTMFLTFGNIAGFLAPLSMVLLLGESNAYGDVFIVCAVVTALFTLLFAFSDLPEGRSPARTSMKDTLQCMVNDRDLRAVTVSHFLLYLFYVWAPFYIPVYLHVVIGLPWSELGWMFSVMLIPFILIEYPAGTIADRWWGDKELMAVGFLIAGLSLVSMSLVSSSTPLLIILAILVGSRIGAAFIESMTEGHFFRRVTERDVNTISIFCSLWPLADVVGPLVASLLLLVGGYPALFIICGLIVVFGGVFSALAIHDFK